MLARIMVAGYCDKSLLRSYNIDVMCLLITIEIEASLYDESHASDKNYQSFYRLNLHHHADNFWCNLGG